MSYFGTYLVIQGSFHICKNVHFLKIMKKTDVEQTSTACLSQLSEGRFWVGFSLSNT